MPHQVTKILRRLSRRKDDYGNGAEDRKVALLRTLEISGLRRARNVNELHETLCFLRAYPDSGELLTAVERILVNFSRRADLRRHRGELVNSGIAGTDICFAFFAPTARWLAHHWADQLGIEWDDFEDSDKVQALLELMVLYGETPGMDHYAFEVREWVDRLKSSAETDASFLIRRLEQAIANRFLQENLFDQWDLPLRLKPGQTTPARTNEKLDGAAIAFHSRPLRRSRPAMPDGLYQRPRSVQILSRAQGRKLIHLARSAMATRLRDLDAFAYGSADDVRLIDCGRGLQFAYIGVIPQRRLMLETMYGFLMLKNGVPVGYGTNTCLFRSSEVAYTVFDTFRSGESAIMFVWALAIARRLFRVDSFTIDPYQIGQDNDDAIHSGAWWFYQKLGFEPYEAEARRIMRRELKRMKKVGKHRSSVATLKQLAESSVFLQWKGRRKDVLGVLPLARAGLQVTRYASERFGFDRDRATRVCSREAARLLGIGTRRRWTPGERTAWIRWAPLVMALPGIQRWSDSDKRAFGEIIRCKGGVRELDYLEGFDRHARLRGAIRELAESKISA